jgi:hypothetical protein
MAPNHALLTKYAAKVSIAAQYKVERCLPVNSNQILRTSRKLTL